MTYRTVYTPFSRDLMSYRTLALVAYADGAANDWVKCTLLALENLTVLVPFEHK